MNILDLLDRISSIITIPFLLFLGYVVVVMWRQLEKVYQEQIKLSEKQRDLANKRSEVLQEKLVTASELKAEVDIIKEAGEERLRRLNAERDQLINQLSSMSSHNEQLVKRLQEVEQLSRQQRMQSIEVLAGGIAHDFNNLLSVILLSSENIKKALSQTAQDGNIDRSLSLLESLRAAVARGTSLVRQIVSFARVGEPEYVEINPAELVTEIANLLRETFPSSIELKTRIEEGVQLIRAERTQMIQVLLNLCVNARDAMPRGGKLVIAASNFISSGNTEVETGVLPPGEFVSLSVSDTGTGIEDIIKPRIFEPFFTTKGVGKSTGLGLAVVYGVVKSHHGYIKATAKVGVGTTFTIYLPQSSKSFDSPISPDMLFAPTTRPRVLVVDDDAAFREMLSSSLRDNGFVAFTAESGHDALEFFKTRRNEIDVIVMDMIMPDLTGPEAAKAMLEIDSQAKIILMSGYYLENTKALWKQFCSFFIQKPFAVSDLVPLIRHSIMK